MTIMTKNILSAKPSEVKILFTGAGVYRNQCVRSRAESFPKRPSPLRRVVAITVGIEGFEINELIAPPRRMPIFLIPSSLDKKKYKTASSDDYIEVEQFTIANDEIFQNTLEEIESTADSGYDESDESFMLDSPQVTTVPSKVRRPSQQLRDAIQRRRLALASDDGKFTSSERIRAIMPRSVSLCENSITPICFETIEPLGQNPKNSAATNSAINKVTSFHSLAMSYVDFLQPNSEDWISGWAEIAPDAIRVYRNTDINNPNLHGMKAKERNEYLELYCIFPIEHLANFGRPSQEIFYPGVPGYSEHVILISVVAPSYNNLSSDILLRLNSVNEVDSWMKALCCAEYALCNSLLDSLIY